MDENTKKALQDRFSGYQLPKVDLSAGFPSYQVPVHPYFYNQPLEWTKPAYTKYSTTGTQSIEGQYPIQPPGYSKPETSSSEQGINVAGSSGSSSVIVKSSKDTNSNEPRTDLLPI